MTVGEDGVAATGSRLSPKGALSVAIGVAFLVAGFVTAPIASLVSRMCWRPGAVTIPYGLVLAAAASMSLVLLAREVSRAHALAAAGGWIVALGFVVNGTSGGSFLIAGDALGWGFLALG